MKIIYALILFFGLKLYAQNVDQKIECPTSQTKDKLEEWRNQGIALYTSGKYRLLKNSFESCFSAKIPNCLDDLFNQVNVASNAPNWVDNLPRVEPLTIDSEKDLPKEFLVKGFFGGTKDGLVKMPDNIIELAKKNGWEALSYKTRSTGGFDAPPNLLMVVIPGRDKDIYIQTSPHGAPQSQNDPTPLLTKEQLAKGQNTMTIITVDKTTNPPVGQLRLLTKEDIGFGGDRSGGDAPGYRWNNRLQTQQCTECHSTPLRSISPIGYKVVNGAEKRMSAEDEATTTRINEMMVVNNLSWGRVRMDDGTKMKLGPNPSLRPMGWRPPGSEDRKEDQLVNCANKSKKIRFTAFGGYSYDAVMSQNPKIDFNKVKSAMDCTQCHNGSIRGPLNKNFSDREIAFKILVDRSMPPGAELTDDERIAVYNCLNEERFDQKLDEAWNSKGEWLKREMCSDAPTRRVNRMNLNPPQSQPVGTGR